MSPWVVKLGAAVSLENAQASKTWSVAICYNKNLDWNICSAGNEIIKNPELLLNFCRNCHGLTKVCFPIDPHHANNKQILILN